jgi:hypothetical protein
MTTVRLINQSKKINSTQTKVLAAGLQQYGNLVAKAWGLEPVKVVTTPTAGAWEFYFVDTPPAGFPPTALGYHDYKNNKIISYISTVLTIPAIDPLLGKVSPFGIIIPAIDSSTPEFLMPMSFMEVLSHELADALLDANVNRYALNEVDGLMWFIETADHAGAYRFAINVPTLLINGRKTTRMICQDFTLPSFYTNQAPAPYSYTGKVSDRFTIDAGCYGYFVQGGAGHTVGFDIISGGADEK